MSMKQWRVAVVVQRYGEEVNGGAELHARWLAEHLLPLAEVHVITTCAVDYYSWENVYEPGDSLLNGVRVHRFTVDEPREWSKFQKLTGQILNNDSSPVEQLEWMKKQGPLSRGLLSYVEEAYPHFDAFIFFTYLYATTFYGLPLVADKAILVPTAHDEPFLYLPIFRPLFHLPHSIVYNTTTEKRLVNRVTRNGRRDNDHIAGIGINVPQAVSAARFRQKYGVQGNFALYMGRMDHSKNVPELLDYFLRYRENGGADIALALAGKGVVEAPAHPAFLPLGFVREEDKFDAIEAATLVIVPSRYESLSMITLEAWTREKPVLVNGDCEVLKDLVRASNGGLYYSSYAEFAATLDLLLERPALREQLGRNGRRHVTRNYDWPVITAIYQQLLEKLTAC
jgi:glycosyltransferase involved in cell wall biosynthesis